MVDVTLNNDEETVAVYKEGTHVTNAVSFQNTTNKVLRWSRIEFSDTNDGSECEPGGERIFSESGDIYFLHKGRGDTKDGGITGKIQVRSKAL